MLISEEINTNPYQVRGYQPGQVTINDKVYTHSVILTAHALLDDWPPRHPEDLTPEMLAPILAFKPKIILLGTGRQFIRVPQRLLAPIYQAHLGVEVMSTGAACRTFVALSAEGREVVAALLLGSE